MMMFIPMWLYNGLIWCGYLTVLALGITIFALVAAVGCYAWIVMVEWWTRAIHCMITKFIKDNPRLIQEAREGKLK
jgi:hypothetical protein